jgi:hypothetical protein
MEIKNISHKLKQSIQKNQAETLDLSPGEIAGFLEICRLSLREYIYHANEQVGPDSEAYIPSIELEKIDSIFRELTDNFFPMAHSNESLRRLQIVDKDEYRRVMEGLLHLTRMSKDAHVLSKSLSESIDRLIHPFFN